MSAAEDLDEREVKLALDDDFTMPAAADLAPARMDDRGVAELRSEYWDTADLALARANRGLRHRNGIWTYKGQSRRDGDSVVREEREIEGAADHPPAALAARVADVASVKGLRVVAVLVNQRHTWCVRDGAEEVELVHDHVDVLRGTEVVESFAEAEVEFALDSAPLADRVVRVLTARGATVNPMGKYSRALRALGLRPLTGGDATDAR